jgi:hypothetical protein
VLGITLSAFFTGALVYSTIAVDLDPFPLIPTVLTVIFLSLSGSLVWNFLSVIGVKILRRPSPKVDEDEAG